jgi:ubiquinone/menaquinone biosynthesis C-methylase UbiE
MFVIDMESVMPVFLSSSAWHLRFQQQAGWTRDLRHYLYRKASFFPSARVLDLGCGPGALLGELIEQNLKSVIGLDLSRSFLALARRGTQRASLTQGDALNLPFAPAVFNVSLCHFVLLWLANPQQALNELVRVTRPGGAILALAEPDYGGRIDFPVPLAELGTLQTEALRRQGADTLMGRQLASLFHRTGLTRVETGLLGGQWSSAPPPQEWQSEWQVLEADLQNLLPPSRLEELGAIDRSAWQRGERVLFVPTFYAIGFVPG